MWGAQIFFTVWASEVRSWVRSAVAVCWLTWRSVDVRVLMRWLIDDCVDPRFDCPLVCEDEDSTIKVVSLTWQLEVVDGGAGRLDGAVGLRVRLWSRNVGGRCPDLDRCC